MNKINDPFNYLKGDHKKVSQMLERLSNTTENAEKTRTEVFEELYQAFNAHAELEEKYLYPMLKQGDTSELVLEALEEHKAAKTILDELKETSYDSEEWLPKLKVFKENVEHHVDEEENTMFPKAEKTLSNEEKEKLTENINNFLLKK